jgi:hypothetical protein
VTLVLANVVLNALPNLPKLEPLRDRGLATLMALVLWGVAVALLWKRSRTAQARQDAESLGRAAA